MTESALAEAVILAPPPYLPPRRSLPSAVRTYLVLLRMLLLEYRSTWSIYVFLGLLFPLGYLFFLTTTGSVTNPERAIFALGGNLAVSIATGPLSLLGKIGWARQTREFEYWLALPVPKIVFVLALVSVGLILSLPALIVLYLVGSLMLSLPLLGSPVLILLVPLGALSLAGYAAFLAVHLKDGPSTTIAVNAALAFVYFLSPMMIPLDALPAPLRILALFVPTTYVADASRAILAGRVDTNMIFDLAILALFSVVSLALVHRRLDWRST